jgi:O-antigen/teichoic acid export membrane protein
MLNTEKSAENLSVKGKLKFLAKDSIFFGGLRAISLVFPFLTIPILTRYFSVEEFGLLDSITVLSGLLTTVIIFGQDSAIARFLYDYSDKAERNNLISEGFLIQIFTCLIVTITFVVFGKNIAKHYSSNSSFNNYIFLIAAQSAFLFINNFSINLIKWTLERKQYALLSILQPLLQLSSLLIVYFNKLSFDIYILLITLSTFVISFVGLWFVRKWLIIPREYKYYKKMILFSLPLGTICVIGSLLPAIDRKFISTLLTPLDLGLYAFGYKIAGVMSILNSVFQLAWGPFYLGVYKEANAQQTFNVILKLFTFVLISCATTLIYLSNPFIKLAGTEKYAASAMLVVPIAYSFIITSIGNITEIGIGLSYKNHYKVISYLFYLCVSIVLTYSLIKLFGLIGVAYALLLSNITRVTISTYIAHKVYAQVKFRVFNVIVALLLSFLLLHFFVHNILPDFFLQKELLLLFIVASTFFVLINTNERKILAEWTLKKIAQQK